MKSVLFLIVLACLLCVGAPVVAQNENIPACSWPQAWAVIKAVDEVEVFRKVKGIAEMFVDSDGKTVKDGVSMAILSISYLDDLWNEKRRVLPRCAAAMEIDLYVTRIIGELNRLASLFMVRFGEPLKASIADIEKPKGEIVLLAEALRKSYDGLYEVEDIAIKFEGKGNKVFADAYFTQGTYDIRVKADTDLSLMIRVNDGQCEFEESGTALRVTNTNGVIVGVLKVNSDCRVTLSVIGVDGFWETSFTPG